MEIAIIVRLIFVLGTALAVWGLYHSADRALEHHYSDPLRAALVAKTNADNAAREAAAAEIANQSVKVQTVYVERKAKLDVTKAAVDTEVAKHESLPDAACVLDPARVSNINRAWGFDAPVGTDQHDGHAAVPVAGAPALGKPAAGGEVGNTAGVRIPRLFRSPQATGGTGQPAAKTGGNSQ
jgi:hypothetical protein